MSKLKFRTISLGLSTILSLASVVVLFGYGLNISIDFTGGQVVELRFKDPTALSEIRAAVPHTTVFETTPNTFEVRTSSTDPAQIEAIRTTLTEAVGESEQIRFEQVGPTVGTDLTRKAVLGVGLASLGIILYIAWAFRHVPKPANSWQFGITAIVALLHDLLITIGAFALLGEVVGFEVDAMFITALLTVMGFSVHDTIVTYDRIRENLLHHQDTNFEVVVNESIRQTIVRSLNTSLTLLLVLLAILLLGGSSIRPFAAALTIGIAIGTYSSIFVATQLLVVWQKVRMSDVTRLPARQGNRRSDGQ